MLTKRVVGLSHRFAYATVAGLLCWVFAAHSFQSIDPRMSRAIALTLDAPVVVANHLLPSRWRGLNLFSGQPQGEFIRHEEILWLHLRAAIPTYVALFYVPNLICLAMRAWRRRRV